jgi:hypothetical protein
MTADDKALKARLMAEAEGAIDKLSAGRSDKEDLQLMISSDSFVPLGRR